MFYCSTGLSITSDVFVHIKCVIFLSWCFFTAFSSLSEAQEKICSLRHLAIP